MTASNKILIAELGATKARLAITEDQKTLINLEEFQLQDFVSAEQLFNKYFDKINVQVDRAIVGVAAPVLEDEIRFTNIDIEFNQKTLKEGIFQKQLWVLNDLELQAHALEGLDSEEVLEIGDIKEEKKGSKILVSPGTGLGLAGIVGNQVIFTEAGHLNIPSNLQGFNSLIKRFEEKKERMATFEDFLSGKGINYIYCQLSNSNINPYSNEEILINSEDPNCLKTRDLMLYLLAIYLRYVALIWGSTSGVYLSGSIANSLIRTTMHKSFRKDFENSSTMRELLLKIPTYLIKDLNLGLKGGLKLASKG